MEVTKKDCTSPNISSGGNRHEALSLLREEDALAEVHAVVGGLDVVAEEEGREAGEEGDQGEADGAPDRVEVEGDEVTEGVGLNAVHIY